MDLKKQILDVFVSFTNSDIFLMAKGRILYELNKCLKEIGIISEMKILLFQNEDFEQEAESMMLKQKEEKIKQVQEILPEVSAELASFALTKNGDDTMMTISVLSEGSIVFYREELNMIEKRKREILKGGSSERLNQAELDSFFRLLSNYEILYDMIFKLMKLNHMDLNDILWKLLQILPLSQKTKQSILMETQNAYDFDEPEDLLQEENAWKFNTHKLVQNPSSYTSCYQLYVLGQIVRENKDQSVIEWLLFEGNLQTISNIFANPLVKTILQEFQQRSISDRQTLVNVFRFFGYLLSFLNFLGKVFINPPSFRSKVSRTDSITHNLVKEIEAEERGEADGFSGLFEEFCSMYQQVLESNDFVASLRGMLASIVNNYEDFRTHGEADIFDELIDLSFEFLTGFEKTANEKPITLRIISELVEAACRDPLRKNPLFLNLVNYHAALHNFETTIIRHNISQIKALSLDQLPVARLKLEITRDLVDFLDKKKFRLKVDPAFFVDLIADLKSVFDNVEQVAQGHTEQAILTCNELFYCMRQTLKILEASSLNIREDLKLLGFYQDFLVQKLFEMFGSPEGFLYNLIVDSESKVRTPLFDMIETFCTRNSSAVISLLQRIRTIYSPDDFKSSQMNFVDVRKSNSFIGIKNLGCTCYANSLMQQLFHNHKIRDFVVNLPVDISQDNPSVLRELKLLFSQLTFSKMSQADLLSFTRVFTGFEGQQINVKVQQDVNEFFNLLLDIIENEIRELKLPVEDAFHIELGGKFCNEITSLNPEFEYQASNEERFNTLSLDVKNMNSMSEALDKFFRTEVFDGDNKLFIEKYDTKIEVKKNCWLSKDLPSTMVIMLKRFEYDMTTYTRFKLNDYFEFPLELNLAKWVKFPADANQDLLEDTSPFKYRLKGVLVHSGTSEMGHYYSYIFLNNKWVEFNDTKVADFDPTDQNLKREWYGGDESARGSYSRNNRSAYMLFYEKLENFEKNSRAQDLAQAQTTSEVLRVMEELNRQFLRRKVFSDSSTLRFLNELLNKLDFEEGIQALQQLLLDESGEALADGELLAFLKNFKSIVLQKLSSRSPLLQDLSPAERGFTIIHPQAQSSGEPFVAFDFGVFENLIEKPVDQKSASDDSNKAVHNHAQNNGFMFDSYDEQDIEGFPDPHNLAAPTDPNKDFLEDI